MFKNEDLWALRAIEGEKRGQKVEANGPEVPEDVALDAETQEFVGH